MTRNATNGVKHINEASKQMFSTIRSKYHVSTRKSMVSFWKSCFKAPNVRKNDELLCNLSKYNKTVWRTTCTNFPIWCQQTTKTNSKCNTDSFGPVCQLWTVTIKHMRDSKPQRCVQHDKSLKVTRNVTKRDKHINDASKQNFANNLFKISCKYTQGMPSS